MEIRQTRELDAYTMDRVDGHVRYLFLHGADERMTQRERVAWKRWERERQKGQVLTPCLVT